MLSQARSYKKPPIDVPPFPFYKVGAPTLSEYDTAAELMAIADGQMTSNVSGDTISMTSGPGEYLFLFSPVSNGEITFLDLTGGAGTGGWDGAEWPLNGDLGISEGPLTISLDFGAGAEDWYVYRTDWADIGAKTFRLTYSRYQF